MKKLVSLVLAIGMLASVCAPAVYAMPNTEQIAMEEMATSETAVSDAVTPAANQTEEEQAQPETQPEVQPNAVAAAPAARNAASPDLTFRIVMEDGTTFTGADPFADMTMVVGEKYTFYPLIEGKTLPEAGYTLQYAPFWPAGDTEYFQVESVDTQAGSFVLVPLAVSGTSTFLGSLNIAMLDPNNSICAKSYFFTGATVADNGNILFTDEKTGLPVSSLKADPDNQQFRLSLAAYNLNPDEVEIEYDTTLPDSILVEQPSFAVLSVQVQSAFGPDAFVYATVKDKNTGAVLKSASVSLSWSHPIEADTLPGGDKIYFGKKQDNVYSSWYSTVYNRVEGGDTPFTTTETLNVFFGTTDGSSYLVDYTALPKTDTVSSITVESLNPDVLTVSEVTQADGENPFSFQYAIRQDAYTTAQIKATVTLADGTTKTALFTIDVVENAQAQEKTVSNGNQLAAVLQDGSLTPGSTIYLNPGTYTGNFVVTTPVSLIASRYNGSEDLYDENGQPVEDSGAAVIEGSITAQAQEVGVYGLRFQCPEGQEGLTALCDAEAVTGCTFTGYDTAVVLSKEVHSYTNYRVVKNAFVDNRTALCFAGREWRSNVQNNSFLNNDVALTMGESSYVDGLQSTAYKATVNGGKWTNNYFRGQAGQLVLQDSRSDFQKAAAVLLLNYNYYAYGDTAGAVDSLFSAGANADYSVYYTTPEMAVVSTNKSLAEVAEDGGLNLMAQQSDTTVADTALNVSGELFESLKTDTTDELTLNVWKDNETLAAAWDFSADAMKEEAADDVNLGVNETLSTEESSIVEAELPEGVTAQTISFAHEGELPGTATVEVPETAALPSTDDLGLYYIDEKTGELELQDTEVTLTEDGKLRFSIDHCSSYLVASKSAMTPPPEAPDASAVAVDYAAETLTFDGNTYEVNTASDFSGQALASGDSLSALTGTAIYVRVKAQGDTPAGAATKVTLPARPAAPGGLQAEMTSYADTRDGILRGVTDGMEYKAADAAEWISCSGTEISGLAAGTYQVRLQATDTDFAGEPAEIAVEAGPKRVYAISVEAPVFADLTYGQTPDAPQPLVITNEGNCEVAVASVVVDTPEVFALQGSGTHISVGGKMESYTLQPVAGLDAGSYTGTVTLTYLDGSEKKTIDTKVTLTVNKATATEAMNTVSANVTVGTDAMVTLPGLPQGAAYGTPAGNEYLSNLRLADGSLSFTVSDALKPGTVCEVTVPVTGGANYEDYDVTVALTGVAKPVPQLGVGTLSREYNGKAVTLSELPGKTAAYEGKTVKGSWSFAQETAEIKNAGTYSVTLVFTPDSKNFDSNTIQTSITITPRPAEITPNLSESNQVKVGETLPDFGQTKLKVTGLVAGEELSISAIGLEGQPENTDKAGRWDIGLAETTRTAIQKSEVGKNYRFTFHTIPFLVLGEDSVVTAEVSDKYKVVQDEVRGEAGSGFDTAEAVRTELLRVLNTRLDGATADNTMMQDITLYISTDGVTWTEATGENIPAGGVTVTLPYPAELEDPRSYTFTVVHMRKDGSVETLPATKQEQGIQFTMTSFSPVAISWAPVKEVPAEKEPEPSTTTVTSTPAPSVAPAPSDTTTYYTCPACGRHDWTATEDGYRCDNCGYLESTRQLSGYGNVQGSYTPGNAPAAGKTTIGTLPQTGDESHLLVWVALLVVAALGLGSLAWYKQKRK